MDLYIRLKTGARASDVFKISSGVTIGRGKANVNLMDSKASTLHARIESVGADLYFIDLGSTNGSYVAGKKIQKVKITPGLIIVIGATEIEVVTEFDLKKNTTALLSEWREKIYDLLQKTNPVQSAIPLEVFDRAVVIKVTGGTFTGQEWSLGYGPRFLGPGSADLCLPDASLPSLCLKISKQGSQIKIESTNQKKYAFNGVEKDFELLDTKVSVAVGENILEIEFL